MKTYRVNVSRDGRYWVAVVDGLRGGATETRALAALEDEVRDLISGLTDVDPHAFGLDWDYGTALPQPASAAVVELETWRHHKREAEAKYAEAQVAAARKLSAAGVSVRDAAQLLHVSPGRVSQLAPAAKSGTRAAAKQPAKVSKSAARKRST